MIPRRAMTQLRSRGANALYWYWYSLGQKARKRDMRKGGEQRRIQGPEDSPSGAPNFGTSEYYSFLDGYFLRHGFQ